MYHAQGPKDLKSFKTFQDHALGKVADLHPAVSKEQVFLVNWIDMAEEGLGHSKSLPHLSELVHEDNRHHSEVACACILLPNTPKYGEGLVGPLVKGLIYEARKEVKEAFRELPDTSVTSVNLFIDEDQCYSSHRELSLQMLLVMSNKLNDDGSHACQFEKSYLVKRKAVPKMLPVLHRRMFQDWGRKMNAASNHKFSEEVDLKHWQSGRLFLKPILEALFCDMDLTANSRVVIRHWSMFCPELGIACQE